MFVIKFVLYVSEYEGRFTHTTLAQKNYFEIIIASTTIGYQVRHCEDSTADVHSPRGRRRELVHF